MNHNQIKNLLSKLNSNTISPSELETLKTYFTDPTASKVLLEEFKTDFEHIQQHINQYPEYTNAENTRQRLLNSIHPHKSAVRSHKNIIALVACLIVLLMTTYYLFQYRSENKNIEEWITVTTPHGIRKKVTLPDSTTVLLNGNSTLTYPQWQPKNFRIVKIQGEGFFDVKPDKQRPFFVIAPQYTTKVVGTSFNINTDINANIEVRSGVVQSYVIEAHISEKELINHFVNRTESTLLHIIESRAIELKAGDIAYLDENKNWLKQKHDQLLWINNELVYFNEPLKNVIKSAHRNFGDSIVIDKSLEDVKITITFKGKTKEQVIYTLGELANAKVKFNKQKNVWEMRTK
ncbi:FecR family protein [Sphingobacterium sp. T2]|uniref:FecR family protein n=1 Tax=Sphingobacterium sp. T2 TaxID=1590596 RepID=UPI00057BA2C6|nr:FecR family protein [Sphingobacterium sp. T2]